ncbi:MAG TPA: hypothetical protein VD886_21300 [Herpetosiphonaceae bacterium]|nr:hypothetical protein [Herpetosiphonaceae bacterium]
MASVLHTGILIIHVLAGMMSLVMGVVAMVTRKGGKPHRRWGRGYMWAMGAIFVTALMLLYFRPNIFLFVISILSFYSALTGDRVLLRKFADRGQRAGRIDWIASGIGLAAGAGFMAWGGLSLAGMIAVRYPPVFFWLGIGFGFILARDAFADLRQYRRPATDRQWWIYFHIERMLSSYMAAVTAFMVQNVGRRMPVEIGWITWVAPAMIGVPAIAYWVRIYRKKFAARPAKAQNERDSLAEAGLIVGAE